MLSTERTDAGGRSREIAERVKRGEAVDGIENAGEHLQWIARGHRRGFLTQQDAADRARAVAEEVAKAAVSLTR